MNYFYYPGCSLEGTAQEYDASTRALFAALGADLTEVEGWTCCGAGAAESVSRLLALALPARNLALIEKTGSDADLLVPCSACYLNLKKAAETVRSGSDTARKINEALSVENLSVSGKTRVRHLLDVLIRDIGPEVIHGHTVYPLSRLRVAPYYGCQCLRPYAAFDDPERPCSMSVLLTAAGARILDWRMGGICCGASQTQTKPENGIRLTAAILREAREADAIVTVCPMCQMNLAAFQAAASRMDPLVRPVPVLFLPQVLGIAMGIDASLLRLNANLSVTREFTEKLMADRVPVAYSPLRVGVNKSFPP
ncbi:MAG: disulfide reductase [Desulfobacteraceae bacterium]|nr:MAG: disulfide reductase [Desulfobacteraceae bacterium]